MNFVRTLTTGLAALAATVAVSRSAEAENRMLVLIDASGSMTIARPSDPVSPTRFHAALKRAQDQVLFYGAAGYTSFAVYTFQDASATPHTAGFVTQNQALDALELIDPVTTPIGVTPLAGSICDAVDTLIGNGTIPGNKVLQLASDGEENATPFGHQCYGPPSMLPTAPYTTGSWQYLVNQYLTVEPANVVVGVDLFNYAPIIGLRAPVASNPDELLSQTLRSISAISGSAKSGALADEERPPTLEEFFGEITAATGGALTVINDDTTQLPVYADFNADFCVDRSDALLLARKFGPVTPEVDGGFDLDLDGQIGFSDYALLLSHRTPGCGIADPYVARAPVVCTAAQGVVIDGQSIEAGGISIEARGACVVTIRNSLIVAGQSAIKITGGAFVRLDNSIVIGQGAVIATQGAAVVSAANTVFHGRRQTTGAFVYFDRGGNTWE